KWPFEQALPAQALPRWNALQKAIGEKLKPFGVDRAARDGSRCLRLVGSVNPRSGQECRTVWTDERYGDVARWDFETLCREVLPVPREQLQARRKEAKEQAAVREGWQSNWWNWRELWWYRLADVRKLITLREWQNGVPVGYRNHILLVAACAV